MLQQIIGLKFGQKVILREKKAQLRVDEGYFLKYAMRELKDRRLQVITHEEHENFKKLIKKYDKNEKICD